MNKIRLLRSVPREWILLSLILILSITLNTMHLNLEGYGNLYYAAGIKSMLESWHNFFYLAYDPGGFVSIDKPPLGFWMQAVSAKLFGFYGWALMLPQIIAGVLSVFVLYRLVSRFFGAGSGLIAAVILAVTPISVAASRNNTIDSILVFVLLLAAWMLFKASEDNGRMRWIIASAVMIGVGFNIKMMEAYLVLPAFAFFLIYSSQLERRLKIRQLLFATVIIIVVSVSWAVIVDLTPVNQRPYIGSTSHNSVLELMLQHNAAGRFNGVGNPLRFLKQDLGGQISWLLPFALLSVVFILWKAPIRQIAQLSHNQRVVLFWFAWLVPMAVSFGTATLFHRYYTVMMGPAIAALSGIGFVQLWKAVIQGKRSGWILFAALPITALFGITISWSFPEIRILLASTICGLTVACLCALIVIIRFPAVSRVSLRAFAMTTCLLALLIGPFAWAATPSVFGAAGSDPVAGPELMHRQVSNLESLEEEKLNDFLMAHYVSGSFLVATPSAETSSPLILDTGLPILTMGGYSGSDPILTKDHLKSMARVGKIKYFLLPKSFDKKQPFMGWIQQNCKVVLSYKLSASAFNTFLIKPNDAPVLYQYVG